MTHRHMMNYLGADDIKKCLTWAIICITEFNSLMKIFCLFNFNWFNPIDEKFQTP